MSISCFGDFASDAPAARKVVSGWCQPALPVVAAVDCSTLHGGVQVFASSNGMLLMLQLNWRIVSLQAHLPAVHLHCNAGRVIALTAVHSV
jgi:hypothetical protein